MRKSKFTAAKRLEILAQWDSGVSVEELCRSHQVSAATLYKWEKDAAIEADDTLRELNKLRQENARLKKMYSELSIDHEILQEGYAMAKKYAAQDAKKQ